MYKPWETASTDRQVFFHWRHLISPGTGSRLPAGSTCSPYVSANPGLTPSCRSSRKADGETVKQACVDDGARPRSPSAPRIPPASDHRFVRASGHSTPPSHLHPASGRPPAPVDPSIGPRPSDRLNREVHLLLPFLAGVTRRASFRAVRPPDCSASAEQASLASNQIGLVRYRLEIRAISLRNRRDVVIEKVQVVFCADHFSHESVGHASPSLDR
jgi:hypothetical protein